MRALVCSRLGDPTSPLGSTNSALAIEQRPSPAIRPGHVRISVAAASLNFPDALQVQARLFKAHASLDIKLDITLIHACFIEWRPCLDTWLDVASTHNHHGMLACSMPRLFLLITACSNISDHSLIANSLHDCIVCPGMTSVYASANSGSVPGAA